MDKSFIVIGLKRSGHHAIVNWIAENSTGTSLLYNHCQGIGKRELIPDGNLPPEQIGSGSPTNHIYNIEDFNPVHKPDFTKFPQIARTGTLKTILVLRNPYNWIASCMKAGGSIKERLPSRIKVWKCQALEFDKNPQDMVLILFDKWFSNMEYRIAISQQLRLPTFEKGINKVSKQGGGSSFDGMGFQGSAQSMKVLERYNSMLGNPEYIQYISDKELATFSQNLFKFNLNLSNVK